MCLVRCIVNAWVDHVYLVDLSTCLLMRNVRKEMATEEAEVAHSWACYSSAGSRPSPPCYFISVSLPSCSCSSRQLIASLSSPRIACCFFILVLSRYRCPLTGACPIVRYKLRPTAPRDRWTPTAVCFE